jgi:transposase
MRTHQAQHAFVCEHFYLEALPRPYHEEGIPAVCDVLLETDMPKSEFCRLIFLDASLAFFTEFSQTQIAEFLDLARSLVSQCKAQSEEDRTTEARRQVGRPSFLQPENEQSIRHWLKRRVTTCDWRVLREVKEQIVAELEQTGVEAARSKSYYTRRLAGLLGSDFTVRVAQPLQEDRFNVKIKDIVQHFANLEELEISHISSHRIANLDETGFGASKSRTQKSRKGIVPQSLSKKLDFKETSDSHFITALCAISASGNLLRSGLIAKGQTDQPDTDQCSFLRNVQRYVSPNAFITRQIFNDYLRNVLSPYLAHWRESVGADARAILFLMATGRNCPKC